VHGVDASPEALAAGHFEAYSAVSLVAADEPDALPQGPFSLIACLDVLEHVADDAGLLRALAARLAPDGRLLVSVPLWPELFCAVDELAGHRRRYAPEALPELFASSGLQAVATSGYIVSLLPLARRKRRRVMSGKAAPVAELATPPAPLNAVLSLWAVAEGSLCRFWELPPGLSQLAALRLASSGIR
jgi:SAM-dependent methyltransferase